MISIQQIQYILALNDFGQFQKASEACHVTQPTLSMQVKKAEEMLGHKIFHRAASPLKTSAFGEKLIPILRDLMRENSKIEQLIQMEEGSFVERIRIGIIPTISGYLVSEIFDLLPQKLKKSHLQIVELPSLQLIELLKQRELDLIIMAGPYVDAGFQSVKLFEEELKIFSKKIKKAEIDETVIQNLRPWLLNEGNCLRSQMISFCNIQKETDQIVWDYEGGNLELLIRMVEQQGGYTLVPEHYPLNKVQLKHLSSIRISDNGFSPGRSVIGVYPNRTVFHESIQSILHKLQHRYSTKKKRTLDLIGWQGA
jgi:LysR family hydrogen peroxide-inducible transcriptional activator